MFRKRLDPTEDKRLRQLAVERLQKARRAASAYTFDDLHRAAERLGDASIWAPKADSDAEPDGDDRG